MAKFISRRGSDGDSGCVDQSSSNLSELKIKYSVVRRADPHKSSVGCDDRMDGFLVGSKHDCHRARPDAICQVFEKFLDLRSGVDQIEGR